MVVPVGQSDAVQTLIRVRRGEKRFDYDELRQVRFVPLVEGLGQTRPRPSRVRNGQMAKISQLALAAGGGPAGVLRTGAGWISTISIPTCVAGAAAAWIRPTPPPQRAASGPGSARVISYPGYQVAIARQGDTVATIAARLGLNAAELAGNTTHRRQYR